MAELLDKVALITGYKINLINWWIFNICKNLDLQYKSRGHILVVRNFYRI